MWCSPCLFINYTYARGCTCIRRHLKETVPWGTITWSGWKNKTYELKRSVGMVLEFFGWVPCYWWLKIRMNGKTLFNNSNDMVVSWLARLVVRNIPVMLSVLASLHNGLTSSVKENKQHWFTSKSHDIYLFHCFPPKISERAISQNQLC